MRDDLPLTTDGRILILCAIVERLAEVIFVTRGRDNDEMKEVYEALHVIKVGMGDLKE